MHTDFSGIVQNLLEDSVGTATSRVPTNADDKVQGCPDEVMALVSLDIGVEADYFILFSFSECVWG